MNQKTGDIHGGWILRRLYHLVTWVTVSGTLALGGPAVTDIASAAHLADRIVAIVNAEVITLSELKAEIAVAENRLKARYKGEQLNRQLQQLEYEALTSMIEHKLQLQAAESMGVRVSEDEVSRALREMQSRNQGLDLSGPEAKQNLRKRLMLMKLVEREVRSGIMISEEDMKAYYEDHQELFAFSREYRISQILIRPRTGEDEQAARERAAAVFHALQDGADFGEMAVRHSDGAEAVRGGKLGTVREGEILPLIESQVKTMKPGEISEPIQTPLGLHIIRFDELMPLQSRPFDSVRQQIQERLYYEKSQQVYRTWIAELKDKAYIEVKF